MPLRIAAPAISKLSSLLACTDVEVRITAGEAIALVLEFAYDYDEVRSAIQAIQKLMNFGF